MKDYIGILAGFHFIWGFMGILAGFLVFGGIQRRINVHFWLVFSVLVGLVKYLCVFLADFLLFGVTAKDLCALLAGFLVIGGTLCRISGHFWLVSRFWWVPLILEAVSSDLPPVAPRFLPSVG